MVNHTSSSLKEVKTSNPTQRLDDSGLQVPREDPVVNPCADLLVGTLPSPGGSRPRQESEREVGSVLESHFKQLITIGSDFFGMEWATDTRARATKTRPHMSVKVTPKEDRGPFRESATIKV
jgi:hypothetical protein